jgi:hypothetical protein
MERRIRRIPPSENREIGKKVRILYMQNPELPFSIEDQVQGEGRICPAKRFPKREESRGSSRLWFVD